MIILLPGASLHDEWILQDISINSGATLACEIKVIKKPSLKVFLGYSGEILEIMKELHPSTVSISDRSNTRYQKKIDNIWSPISCKRCDYPYQDVAAVKVLHLYKPDLNLPTSWLPRCIVICILGWLILLVIQLTMNFLFNNQQQPQASMGHIRSLISKKTGLPVSVFRLCHISPPLQKLPKIYNDITVDKFKELYDCKTMGDYGLELGSLVKLEIWDGWKEFINSSLKGCDHMYENWYDNDIILARIYLEFID